MSADKDLISVQQARDLVEAAHRAQAELARFEQSKIDHICEAMAQAALRESPRVAALAVEETGYGVPADKQEKNRFAAEDVWNYFKNLRTVGVVSETKDVVEIASPRGVVAGIIPSTNPTSTAIFKILIAIKSRNAIVLSPHPSAARCINETVKAMREAGVKEGLPADAIGCMTTASIEGTEALMKHKMTAVILCFIKASVPSIVAVVMHPIASAGNPSFTPASRMAFTVSLIQRAADGCGESTIAFRDLIAIRILKIAVEVGLVEGMMPATTPRGLAISTTSLVSLTTPTVRRLLK